ncbi:MAG: DUF3048 domain-containing protein [Clostridia bacterium]|nr:DUF3048 domain-containing protein [Clostridia bacterium]
MKNRKELIILVSILVILIIVAGVLLGYKIMKKEENVQEESIQANTETKEQEEAIVVPEKEIQIYKGQDRPIAIMIDNHSGAWPQANLSKAYIVYEIVVEGGETRLMAVFKGQELEKIGPVRSSRHYFLDYAIENDAIYVHHGWSPQAQSDISKLGINNINGIQESSSSFWRVKDKSAPHNLFTSTEKILKIADRKGYKKTSDKKSVLKYIADEYELSEKYKSDSEGEQVSTEKTEQILEASKITIPHSNLQTVKYEYNAEMKAYTRYARGKLQKDYITGEPVRTKNIIIVKCDNYTLTNDSESKGRQGLNNIGTFEGYYITNGKAIQIKATKSARNAQTIYKDLEGNEIDVNDGNTFINICPKDAKIEIK